MHPRERCGSVMVRAVSSLGLSGCRSWRVCEQTGAGFYSYR
jgi:hypothetical protein